MPTSVPRWPTTDSGVDRTGTSFAVMSFGDSAVDAAARWCRELGDAGLPVRAWHELAATGEVLAELRAQVAMATVGWRLMLVGPESDVMQARAVAASGGALDAEITLLVHDE